MKQLQNDITEIKQIIGNKYSDRDKANLVCLADEKQRHLIYGGDSYELATSLAYAVAMFARDEATNIHSFLRSFQDAVLDAYAQEAFNSSEHTRAVLDEVDAADSEKDSTQEVNKEAVE